MQVFFPYYPGYIRSKRNAAIRAYNHKIYVDFPWEIVEFYAEQLRKLWSGNCIDIKSEWNSFYSKNQEYTVSGKPICSFFNTHMSLSSIHKGKTSYGFRVNKIQFERYLETQSYKLFNLSKEAENLGPLQSNIFANFYRVFQILLPVDPNEPKKVNRWRLKTSPDFHEIIHEINRLKWLLKPIDRLFPTYQFFTDLQNLDYSINKLMIQPCYLYLRNILEKIVVVAAIIKITEDFFQKLQLKDQRKLIPIAQSFYNLYYTNLEKVNANSSNLKNCQSGGKFQSFVKDFITKASRKDLIDNSGGINSQNIKKFLEEPKSCLPSIHFGKDIIESMETSIYPKGIGLHKVYSMCSSYIHELMPLPCDSLLELKFFRRFVCFYNTNIERFLFHLGLEERLPFEVGSDIFQIESDNTLLVQFYWANKQKLVNLVKREIKKLTRDKSSSAKMMRESIIDLLSLFRITRPGVSRISQGDFDSALFDNLISGIQEFSYSPSLNISVQSAIGYFTKLFNENKSIFTRGKPINLTMENTILLIYMIAEYAFDGFIYITNT